MWIVRLALRGPYTFVVMSILILIRGGSRSFAPPPTFFRTSTFPSSASSGTITVSSPQEMSDRIVTHHRAESYYTVDNIEHIESQRSTELLLFKVFLSRPRNIQQGIAQITAVSQTQLSSCLLDRRRLYYCYSDPVCCPSSWPSRTKSVRAATQRLWLEFHCHADITVPGVSVPYPMAGKQRQCRWI